MVSLTRRARNIILAFIYIGLAGAIISAMGFMVNVLASASSGNLVIKLSDYNITNINELSSNILYIREFNNMSMEIEDNTQGPNNYTVIEICDSIGNNITYVINTESGDAYIYINNIKYETTFSQETHIYINKTKLIIDDGYAADEFNIYLNGDVNITVDTSNFIYRNIVIYSGEYNAVDMSVILYAGAALFSILLFAKAIILLGVKI